MKLALIEMKRNEMKCTRNLLTKWVNNQSIKPKKCDREKNSTCLCLCTVFFIDVLFYISATIFYFPFVWSSFCFWIKFFIFIFNRKSISGCCCHRMHSTEQKKSELNILYKLIKINGNSGTGWLRSGLRRPTQNEANLHHGTILSTLLPFLIPTTCLKPHLKMAHPVCPFSRYFFSV